MWMFLIILVYLIVSFSSGEPTWFSWVMLAALFIIGIVGINLGIDENYRKKDGKECMENWERYKREQVKRR